MNATKILWGQVLLVSLTVIAFVWTATESTVWMLGFQSGLGHPWFEVLGWQIYYPPAFVWWWFAYDAYARDIFVEGAYITFQTGLVDVLEKQAKKGRLVSVIGKLASRKYRREGEEADRTVTEIVVDLRGEIDFPTLPVAQAGAA